MMRLLATTFAAFVLLSNCSYWSCEYDDDHDDHNHDEVEDVTVEITGAGGLDFDASFEDDDHTQFLSGEIPFSATFFDQEEFFRAEVDKNSSGTGTLCVELITWHDSVQQCTSDPNAHLTVTIFF